MLHQRWRKQLIVKKSAREPGQTKQPLQKTAKEQFFTCHKCDATFTSWKEYRIHLRKHQMQHIIAQGIYKCERCEMVNLKGKVMWYSEVSLFLIFLRRLHREQAWRGTPSGEPSISVRKNVLSSSVVSARGHITREFCTKSTFCDIRKQKIRLGLKRRQGHRIGSVKSVARSFRSWTISANTSGCMMP